MWQGLVTIGQVQATEKLIHKITKKTARAAKIKTVSCALQGCSDADKSHQCIAFSIIQLQRYTVEPYHCTQETQLASISQTHLRAMKSRQKLISTKVKGRRFDKVNMNKVVIKILQGRLPLV